MGWFLMISILCFSKKLIFQKIPARFAQTPRAPRGVGVALNQEKNQASSPICSPEDLEVVYAWVCELRKDYSEHSDIWDLRRHWGTVKQSLFGELNMGTYEFSPLRIYEFDDAVVSVWSSKDMMALKIIANALFDHMRPHLPKSCYHVKGHGGLKRAVDHTVNAIANHAYVLRSDVKGYYDSIDFTVLMAIIESYVQDPILLTLLRKALHRTETRGGNYYEYNHKGIPMGSPLSPLLGAIALIPLDLAMGAIKNIFYARYMDDWVVLTNSKTALRKVVKKTHEVMHDLKFKLHPTKTYIGRITHGFNFLSYYMDDTKLLPSKETIRRFHERMGALYEQSATEKPRRRHKNAERDISNYS